MRCRSLFVGFFSWWIEKLRADARALGLAVTNMDDLPTLPFLTTTGLCPYEPPMTPLQGQRRSEGQSPTTDL